MFRGISNINLDSKGRLAMPKRYRQALQDQCQNQLVVSIDTEQRCLLIYPQHEWLVIEKKLAELPSFNKAARRIQRLLIGHATDVELDSNSRFLLTTPLREYAQLDKKIVLIGQSNKFECWDEQHWQQCRENWLGENVADDEALPSELKSLSL
ncbi:MAG: division/cell wall cluster transcriptional repressor MraZ [Gammaproteobacteria bacterium]|nr:division/cell wall cluster transcriptional repressor MraZ [Gammaproteobacteria bacterium]